jgi:uncharacterized protein (TIGR00730 family)
MYKYTKKGVCMPKKIEKSYKNLEFLNSPEARAIRILCEYEEPKRRFAEENVSDTIVFFGSARAKPLDVINDKISHLERELALDLPEQKRHDLQKILDKTKKSIKLSEYYEQTRDLAKRLTEWDMTRKGPRRYYISTGGGPGIMEAANRGASEVPGGRSVGLGISLPFEENLNSYISDGLGFEFHYFFTRKYWFLYLCKAMVICPGGFGTLDELFETLTLRQTDKIKKPLPTVLFGKKYWGSIFNLEVMADYGTISTDDLDLFYVTDSIDDAFDFITKGLIDGENYVEDKSKPPKLVR